MKTARTASRSKKTPAAGKPLPVPRLKPISAEKLLEFQKRFSPKAKGPGVDGVATVIRLRRGGR
jgi:hypothetical protein